MQDEEQSITPSTDYFAQSLYDKSSMKLDDIPIVHDGLEIDPSILNAVHFDDTNASKHRGMIWPADTFIEQCAPVPILPNNFTYKDLQSIPDAESRIQALIETRRAYQETDTGLTEWLKYISSQPQHAVTVPIPLITTKPTTTSFHSTINEAKNRTAAVGVSAARGVWAGVKKGGRVISQGGYHKSSH